MENKINFEFDALSENECLARVVIAAFIAKLDITVDELEDVKTAVSEAVTNAIIHGYPSGNGRIGMMAVLSPEGRLEVEITDKGKGIADIGLAMQPLFTTGDESERSGMGFSFMEAFMDGIDVKSQLGKGTAVRMWKNFNTKCG
jgi:stage II sporulation protein AB (anti-sigma F factor)